jgi:hypothetical protein
LIGVINLSAEFFGRCTRDDALGNSAPFADMPAPLQSYRQALLRRKAREGAGVEIMAKVLTAVPSARFEAMLVNIIAVLKTLRLPGMTQA